MAKKKCYVCKGTYDSKDMTIILRHSICPNCIERYLHSTEYHKEKFIDDVWGLYKDKPNHSQLKAQVEELHDKYGFNYEAMEWALKFYLKFNKWNQNYLLYQAFPKAYYQARDYYAMQASIKKSMPQENSPPAQVISTTSGGRNFKPPLTI